MTSAARASGFDQQPTQASSSLATDQGLVFLRSRIRTFNQVVLVLGLIFFAFVTAARLWKEEGAVGSWFFGPCNALNLAQVLINVFLIVALRPVGSNGKLLIASRRKVLRAIDVGGTLCLAFICAAYGWAENFLPTQEYHALLAVSNMLVLRAFLIPGTPRTALMVAMIAVLPCFVPVFFRSEGSLAASTLKFAVFFSWSLITVVLSVFAARVIHGLRREVKEAQQLGQYTLIEEIGAGGMGTVYRAAHALLRRPTAIKILSRSELDYEEVQRFEREVQITSELTHPNTISIYDYGNTEDGVFYYAMEYLPGLNLQQLVAKHGAQHPARVIHILRQVLGSLSEAHARGLVHRDIKPANIILCARGHLFDVVKVVDFGLVKPPDDDPSHIPGATESLMGTPRYISPEAIQNAASADARSDLYAVAAVAYFLLTGTHVFSATKVSEMLRQHLDELPETPSMRLGRPFPEDLEALVMQGLAKSPDDRPASARVYADSLAACAPSGRWGPQEAELWWHQKEGEMIETMVGSGRGNLTEMIRKLGGDMPTMVMADRKKSKRR